MIPRCPRYVARNHHSLITAIRAEPGREYVNVRRAANWQDGWDARIYRGQGWDSDPVLVAQATHLATPLEAFTEAVRRMRAEVAA